MKRITKQISWSLVMALTLTTVAPPAVFAGSSVNAYGLERTATGSNAVKDKAASPSNADDVASPSNVLADVASPSTAKRAADDPYNFFVDGNTLNKNAADGWKGFGALSCNNTSRLLMDYKEEHPEQYWEILNALFNPVTGMGLSEVKIEMGADSNTSSGTEPSTMRSEDEEANVLRGAGYHLAADAKSINPNIRISLLRWAEPRWVINGRSDEDKYAARYKWYKDTIDAVYDTYGLKFDWISPNQNETGPEKAWLIYFAEHLDADAQSEDAKYDYSSIRLLGADELKGNSPTAEAIFQLIKPEDGAKLEEEGKVVVLPYGQGDQDVIDEAWDTLENNPLDTVYKVTYPGGMKYENENTEYSYYFSFTGSKDSARKEAYTLMHSIDGLGHHYSSNSTPYMEILNKTFGYEVWYSEGVSSVGNGRIRQHTQPYGAFGGAQEASLDVANLFINSYTNGATNTKMNEKTGYPVYISNGHKTFYIYQPAIGAFYESATYSSKSTLGAYDPWSGWFELDAGYWTTRQFMNFARTAQRDENGELDHSTAWQYVDSACYGGGEQSWHSIVNTDANYITLADPEKKDYSIILTNDSDHSVNYTVTVENMGDAQEKRVASFESRGCDDETDVDYDENWFQRVDEDVEQTINADGTVTLKFTVAPYSIRSITTMDEEELPESHDATQPEAYLDRPALDNRTEDSDVIYEDDFEYDEYDVTGNVVWDYDTFDENFDNTSNGCEPAADAPENEMSYLERRGYTPRYTTDQGGAWEVREDDDGDGYHLEQVLNYTEKPGGWTSGGNSWPETLLGDDKWANYKLSADVRFDQETSDDPEDIKANAVDSNHEDGKASYDNWIGVGGRANSNGNGYTFLLRPNGVWGLAKDANESRKFAFETPGEPNAANGTLASGTLDDFDSAASHHVEIEFVENLITVYLDGEQIISYEDETDQRLSGRVHLNSGFYYNEVDNLKVEAVPGYAAILNEYIDSGDARVVYTQAEGDPKYTDSTDAVGKWYLEYTGASSLYRSLSHAKATKENNGQYLEVPFTGTGFILEGGSVDALVDIYIDDMETPFASDVTINASGRNTGYYLSGLEDEAHQLKIVVKDGEFTLDAIGVYGTQDRNIEKGKLSALVRKLETEDTPIKNEYTPESWEVYRQALKAAKEVLADVDAIQQELDLAYTKLSNAYAALVTIDSTLPEKENSAFGWKLVSAGEVPELQSTITYKGSDGTMKEAEIVWDKDLTEDMFEQMYSTVTVNGTVKGNPSLSGIAAFTVVPDAALNSVEYFIDAGAEKETTPEYEAIKSAYPQLKNEVTDKKSADNSWGFEKDGSQYTWVKDSLNKEDTARQTNYSNPVIYYLPLEAGTYDIYSGHKANKGNKTVVTEVTKDIDEANVEQLATGEVELAKEEEGVIHVTFTLEEAGLVKYATSTKDNNGCPVSWIAVSKQYSGTAAKDKAIADAKVLIESGNYFKDAQMSAYQECLADLEDAEGDKILEKIEALTAAAKKLNRIDMIDLKRALMRAGYAEGNLAGYEQEGIDAFNEAYANAKKIADAAADYTQADINKAAEELVSALEALQLMEVKTPEADKAAGTYKAPLYVTLTAQEGTTIYYTLDGSAPANGQNAGSKVVIRMDKDTTVRAIAVTEGMTPSKEFKASYHIDGKYAEATDKSELYELYAINQGRAEQDYTEDSWSAFAAAMKEAMDVLIRAEVTAEEIQSAYDKLVQAATQLEARPAPEADKTQLQQLLDSYASLSENDYTGSSWSKFTESRKAARTVIDNKEATDIEIGIAIANLKNSYEGLVKKTSSGGSSSGGSSSGSSSSSYTSKSADNSNTNVSGQWSIKGDKWIFTKTNGSQIKNDWARINDKWYRFDESGNMQTGWYVDSNGKWYMLKADGSMADNEWVYDQSKWYFLNQGGVMGANQWIQWYGSWYYVTGDGSMAENCTTPDGYHVDSEGRWIQ